MLVRKWQMAHGLKADGKIGKATVEAARASVPQNQEKGTEEAAGNAKPATASSEEPDDGGDVLGNPNLMDSITDGAIGEEKREGQTLGHKLAEPGGAAQDANEGLHHVGGFEEQPWM